MLSDHPGLWFVLATLTPLASFVLLLVLGAIKAWARAGRGTPVGAAVFAFLGGEQPGRLGGYVATGAISLAFVFSLIGAVQYFQDHAGEEPSVRVAATEQGKEEPPSDRWS